VKGSQKISGKGRRTLGKKIPPPGNPRLKKPAPPHRLEGEGVLTSGKFLKKNSKGREGGIQKEKSQKKKEKS